MKKTIIITMLALLFVLSACNPVGRVYLEPEEPIPLEPEEPEIPEGCVSWFDGCNNCMVGENGLLACTKMYCEVMEEPKCLEYENEIEIHICTDIDWDATACTDEYDPACGNDGVTYGNGCGACSAGVDSWTEGKCAIISPENECTTNEDCEDKVDCELPIDPSCVSTPLCIDGECSCVERCRTI